MRGELIDAWTTSTFGREEASRRLSALLANKTPEFALVAPVQELGEVLRTERPEATLEAAALYLEELPWSAIANESALTVGTKARGLMNQTSSSRWLLEVAGTDFFAVCRLAGPSLDAAMGVDVLRWIVGADIDALSRIRERSSKIRNDDPRRAISLASAPEVAARVYEAIVGGWKDPEEEVLWLASLTGSFRMMSTGAHHLARRLDLELASPGLTQETVGRGASSVWHEDARPLIELAFKMRPELFYDVLDAVIASPSLSKEQGMWMSACIPWDDDFEVRGKGGTVHARRHGPLVFFHRASPNKPGTLGLKIEKSEATAKESYEKRVSEAEDKAESKRRPPEPARAKDFMRALGEACVDTDRGRVQELLATHPDLKGPIGARLLLAARGDVEIVRQLLAAGADPTLAYEGARLVDIVASMDTWQALRIAELLLADGRVTSGPGLHLAAASGNTSMVRIFLRHGFDCAARDAEGRTPLAVAEKNQRAAAAWLLRQPG